MKPNKSVVLLVNLGSPNELSVGAIRKFLGKFLTDRRVVNLPKYLWYPILFGIILLFRAPKLLKQYKKIWHATGKSPLIYYTEEQAHQLNELIADPEIIVRHAFCYSNPLVNQVLSEIHNKYTVTNLLVIPLYPQFSSTTTATVFDLVTKFYSNKYYLPNIKFIDNFHTNKNYIKAIATKIQRSWNQQGRGERLLFSYHSLPQIIIANGDPYYNQCITTSQLIAEELQLKPDEYIIAFQSKFGRQKWLTPTTSNTLVDLAKENLSVDVICPGFVSDCLETLEEIQVTNQELYFKHGGSKYTYIGCLNADEIFVQTLFSIM